MRGHKCPQDFLSAFVSLRYALFGSLQFSAWRRFHLLDEPPAKPAWLNGPSRHHGFFVGLADRSTQRRRQNGVYFPQVRQTLGHTPRSWRSLPVELSFVQF